MLISKDRDVSLRDDSEIGARMVCARTHRQIRIGFKNPQLSTFQVHVCEQLLAPSPLSYLTAFFRILCLLYIVFSLLYCS